MRRWGWEWTIAVMVLAGCGGTAPGATVTVAPSPTVTASPAVNATATRDAEMAQIATLTAPTATLVPPTPSAAVIPTSPAATPVAAGPQVVTVQGADPLNVRESPDPSATVIALLGAGADAPVLDPTITGIDGTTKWVHVQAGNRDGYVRADFVSAPHTTTAAIPMPIFLATRIPPSLPVQPSVRPTNAPIASPTPNGTGDIYVDYPLIDAGDWAKRPEYYTGKRFSVIGTIFNVRELNGFTFLQINAETAHDDTVPVAIGWDGVNQYLQKGARLRAVGTGAGTFSGTNGFGAAIGQPQMNARYIVNATYARSEPEATATQAAIEGSIATATAISHNRDADYATMQSAPFVTMTAKAQRASTAATTRVSTPMPTPKTTVKP